MSTKHRPPPEVTPIPCQLANDRPEAPFGRGEYAWDIYPPAKAEDAKEKMEKLLEEVRVQMQHRGTADNRQEEPAPQELRHVNSMRLVVRPRPYAREDPTSVTARLRHLATDLANWELRRFKFFMSDYCVVAHSPEYERAAYRAGILTFAEGPARDDPPVDGIQPRRSPLIQDTDLFLWAERRNCALFNTIKDTFTWEGAQAVYEDLLNHLVTKMRNGWRSVFSRPESNLLALSASVGTLLGWDRTFKQFIANNANFWTEADANEGMVGYNLAGLAKANKNWERGQYRKALATIRRHFTMARYMSRVQETQFEVTRHRYEMVARAITVSARLLEVEPNLQVCKWWYDVATCMFHRAGVELTREMDNLRDAYRRRGMAVNLRCHRLIAPSQYDYIVTATYVPPPELFCWSVSELDRLCTAERAEIVGRTRQHPWIHYTMPPMPEDWEPTPGEQYLRVDFQQ